MGNKNKSKGMLLFGATLISGLFINTLIAGFRNHPTTNNWNYRKLHDMGWDVYITEPTPTPEIPKVKNLIEINLDEFWGQVGKELVANQVIVTEKIISEEIRKSDDVVTMGEIKKSDIVIIGELPLEEYSLEGYDKSLTHTCYYLHNCWVFEKDNVDFKKNKNKYKKSLENHLNNKIKDIKEKGIKKIILNGTHFHKEPYQLLSMKEVGDILNKNNFEFYLRKYSIWDFPNPKKLEPWKNNVKVLCNHKNYLELIMKNKK